MIEDDISLFFDPLLYCAFHKHANSEVQKPTEKQFKRQLRFLLPSIILTDLLGNKTLLYRVQKVMVCDLWISIRFVCFSVSRFVACERNYD